MTPRSFSLILPEDWDLLDPGVLRDPDAISPLFGLTPGLDTALAIARTLDEPLLAANLAVPLWADDDDSVAGMLMASLMVMEVPGPVPAVDPEPRVQTMTVNDESFDVLVVQRQCADVVGDRFALLTFTTPNLPLREHFIGLFDRIADTSEWGEARQPSDQ